MRRTRARARVAALLFVLAVAGCKSVSSPPPPPKDPYPALTSADSLIETLARAYQRMDYDKFRTLFADETDARYEFFFFAPGGTVGHWDRTTELWIHQRMFRPDSVPHDAPPVPTQIRLQSVNIILTPRCTWRERTDLYRNPVNPNSAGLDRAKWKATEATYRAVVFFQMAGPSSYLVGSSQSLHSFLVIEDLAKAAGQTGKFLLFRWQDLQPSALAKPSGAGEGSSLAFQPCSWALVKGMYNDGSPPRYAALTSADSLVETLAHAYRRRDYDKFRTLLADEIDAEYKFFFYGPEGTVEQWDRTTELRIHQRMFRPESPPPGEPPVPSELWLQAVTIRLTPQTGWAERADLYRDPADSTSAGLDRAKWKVTEATYRASVFFQMAGYTSYIIDSQQSLQSFLVLEDLAKVAGQAGKFLLFRWQDMQPSSWAKPGIAVGGEPASSQSGSWASVKRLYR